MGKYDELSPDTAVCIMLFGGDWCYGGVQCFGGFFRKCCFDSLCVVAASCVTVSCVYAYHDVYFEVLDES